MTVRLGSKVGHVTSVKSATCCRELSVCVSNYTQKHTETHMFKHAHALYIGMGHIYLDVYGCMCVYMYMPTPLDIYYLDGKL